MEPELPKVIAAQSRKLVLCTMASPSILAVTAVVKVLKLLGQLPALKALASAPKGAAQILCVCDEIRYIPMIFDHRY